MAYRVLIAQFMHETNTFSKLKTTLEDYRKRWLIEARRWCRGSRARRTRSAATSIR